MNSIIKTIYNSYLWGYLSIAYLVYYIYNKYKPNGIPPPPEDYSNYVTNEHEDLAWLREVMAKHDNEFTYDLNINVKPVMIQLHDDANKALQKVYEDYIAKIPTPRDGPRALARKNIVKAWNDNVFSHYYDSLKAASLVDHNEIHQLYKENFRFIANILVVTRGGLHARYDLKKSKYLLAYVFTYEVRPSFDGIDLEAYYSWDSYNIRFKELMG